MAGLDEVFGQAQLVALAADEAVFDVIDKSADDVQSQTAPSLRRDVIVQTNAGRFIDGEVDGRVIKNRDFEPVGELFDIDFDFGAQRLGTIGVLDDVGAGFADGHLDFGDFFFVEVAAFGGLDDHLADLGQRVGCTRQQQAPLALRLCRSVVIGLVPALLCHLLLFSRRGVRHSKLSGGQF